MPHLESLKNGTLFDVFLQYPKYSESLHLFLEDLLRGPSPFTVAERELIAGYVSGLNKCTFCCSVHAGLAEQLGHWENLVGRFLADSPFEPENPKLLPILAYVRKLTLAIDSVGESDVTAIIDAGWSEEAVVQANLICGAFNLFNRWVTGLGVTGETAFVKGTIKQLIAGGYLGVNKMVEEILAKKKPANFQAV